MIDDFDYREDADDKPSPLARTVLWACAIALASLLIGGLLAVLSMLIGGHPWWLR